MSRGSPIVWAMLAATTLGFVSTKVVGQENQTPSAIRVENGIVFGKGGDAELKLDLAAPSEGEGPFPAIVCVHFGGWIRGERQQMQSTLAAFARRGFVAVSPDYRLAPGSRFPAQLEDCKTAVRWLRANAERYRVAPSKIGAFGVSSGGHLACLLGVTRKEDGLEGNGGNAEQSSAVQAVVCFFAPTDLTRPVWSRELRTKQLEPFIGATFDEKPNLYRRASPISYIHKDAPPFLFVHGTADTIVPIQQSEEMVDKLQKAGASARLIRVEKEGHGLNRESPSLRKSLAEAMLFFDENLKK
jgi:acetyl esterase/lipase